MLCETLVLEPNNIGLPTLGGGEGGLKKCTIQFNSIQFNALFQTQYFYTLSVHRDTYNKNILITKKDNPSNNYIIILILTKIVKKLDSAIVKVDIQ